MSLANDLNKIDTDLKQVKTDTNSALSEKGSAGVSTLSELPLAIRNIPSGGGSGISSADYEHIVTDYLVQGDLSTLSFTTNGYPKLKNCKEIVVMFERQIFEKYVDVKPLFMSDGLVNANLQAVPFVTGKKYLGVWLSARQSYWDIVYAVGDNDSYTMKKKESFLEFRPAWEIERSFPEAYKDWDKLQFSFNINPLSANTKINIWGRQ